MLSRLLRFDAKFNDDERLTLCVSGRFMSLADSFEASAARNLSREMLDPCRVV